MSGKATFEQFLAVVTAGFDNYYPNAATVPTELLHHAVRMIARGCTDQIAFRDIVLHPGSKPHEVVLRMEHDTEPRDTRDSLGRLLSNGFIDMDRETGELVIAGEGHRLPWEERDD